jgi:hypothetical protein
MLQNNPTKSTFELHHLNVWCSAREQTLQLVTLLQEKRNHQSATAGEERYFGSSKCKTMRMDFAGPSNVPVFPARDACQQGTPILDQDNGSATDIA